MSLENIINKIQRSLRKGAEILTLGTCLVLPVLSCDHKKRPNPPAQNNNPVITSTPKTSANEGDNFFDKVTASDPDNDPVTYTLTQKPSGMTINSNDGSISWIDASEGNFPITVQASDNRGGTTTQNYTLNISNALDNISGKVKDILNGNAINNGTTVFLGHRDANGNFVTDFSDVTDVNGDYNFSRIPTGRTHLVKLDNPSYLEHLAGSLTTNSDLTDVDFELIPNSFNISFYNEVARNPNKGGQTQRWLQVPQIYINTSPALGSGIQPTQKEIDLAEMIIRNELPRFNNGFTTNNITITKGTNPPPYGTSGVIRFEWNDSRGSSIFGAHAEFLNGNEIISAYADAKTGLTNSQQLYVYKQEQTQTFGARSDSNLEASVFNDPQTPGIDTYQPIDLNLGKILYKRPAGNTSPDNNLDSYQIR